MAYLMKLEELRHKYRNSILALAREHHIENVRVFGSVAAGLETKNSDIDLLVSLGKDADLLDLGGFYYDVQNLLQGQKIDIVPDDSIHWYIKDNVLGAAMPL
jgi:predicted nucleotidyltransferase